MDVTHWSAPYNAVGEITAFGYGLSVKSDYNYKTDFGIWRGNIQFELQKISRSQPTLGSTPVGVKISDTKTPATDLTTIGAKTSYPKIPATNSSLHKGKAQKEHVSEDPESDPKFSDSLSSESDLSNDSNYKIKICDKNGNNRKRKKQE